MSSGGGDRPLLVLHDEEEGHLVYDLLLVDDGGEDVMTCLPRPVAQFASSLIHWCCSFAVSGGSVLGVKYDWRETFFHDTVMKAGGYDFWERQDKALQIRDSEGQLVRWWPMCRRYVSRRLGGSHRDKPAMLPMADGAVVRMDTILFDGIYSFEILIRRRGEEEEEEEEWHAAPLPSPPVGQLRENEIVFVTAYLAVDTRVWISVTNKGTFSMDLSSSDCYQWRKEGTWLLPFEGRALHVPELHAVVGLSAETRRLCPYNDDDIFLLTSVITVPAGLLCACDDDLFLRSAGPPVIRHLWRETYPEPWEECIIDDGNHNSPPPPVSRPRDMPSLAYLGKGRFCICRPMSTTEPVDHGPTVKYDACSLLVVELKRCGNGDDLRLAKRGKTTYMWPPQCRPSPYMGFIQPAT